VCASNISGTPYKESAVHRNDKGERIADYNRQQTGYRFYGGECG